MQIPSNIMKYEATFIGPMTLRMTICVALTAAVEYAYYLIAKETFPDISTDQLVGIGTLLAIPIMAFAIVKPYGMPLEQYIKTAFNTWILAPKKRPYVTENIYDEKAGKPEPAKKKKEVPLSARKLKQHPEYVMYS